MAPRSEKNLISIVCGLLCIFTLIMVIGLIYSLSTAVAKAKMEGMNSYPVTQNERLECPTRNQSYDLRGDVPIVRTTVSPWENSEFGPLNPNACPRRQISIGD